MTALPANLPAPAQRALYRAGLTDLEAISHMTAASVLVLHGVGEKAMTQLAQALASEGLSFAEG